jgi:hypothetical protein
MLHRCYLREGIRADRPERAGLTGRVRLTGPPGRAGRGQSIAGPPDRLMRRQKLPLAGSGEQRGHSVTAERVGRDLDHHQQAGVVFQP